MEDRVFTIDETARIFKVTRQTLVNWQKSGELRTIKIGGRTFVKVEEVERLLNKNEN